MKIILGIIMIAIGVFVVVKSESMLRMFGRIGFMERHLGTEGGSRLGYKLIGIIVIFAGVLIMTNMVGGFLQWLLAPLLKYGGPTVN